MRSSHRCLSHVLPACLPRWPALALNMFIPRCCPAPEAADPALLRSGRQCQLCRGIAVRDLVQLIIAACYGWRLGCRPAPMQLCMLLCLALSTQRPAGPQRSWRLSETCRAACSSGWAPPTPLAFAAPCNAAIAALHPQAVAQGSVQCCPQLASQPRGHRQGGGPETGIQAAPPCRTVCRPQMPARQQAATHTQHACFLLSSICMFVRTVVEQGSKQGTR